MGVRGSGAPPPSRGNRVEAERFVPPPGPQNQGFGPTGPPVRQPGSLLAGGPQVPEIDGLGLARPDGHEVDARRSREEGRQDGDPRPVGRQGQDRAEGQPLGRRPVGFSQIDGVAVGLGFVAFLEQDGIGHRH